MYKSKFKLRELLEISLLVAVALVLSMFKIYRLPQGGNVSLEMVPLLILALRWGFWAGFTGGVIFGVLHLLQGGFIIHPAQLILDYPLAFGSLGVAGLFSVKEKFNLLKISLGVFLAVALRFVCHYFSGIIFFKAYIPLGSTVWIYSLVYNLSYLIPELIICLITVPLIMRLLKKV